MPIPFSQIPEHAKIRIYTSERNLTPREVEALQNDLYRFLSQWAAHGKPLSAGGIILHNRFLILATDEVHTAPSGCSLDAFTGFLRESEQKYDTVLLNHALVAYRRGEAVVAEDFKIVKEKLRQGSIAPDTLMFNNRITKAGQLQSEWKIPIRNSWLAKYLATPVV